MKAAGELPGEAADGKRYSFTGPEDPQVQAIIQRVKSGEIDEATKAALDKLKADAEKKRAAKKAEKEKAEAEAAERSEEHTSELQSLMRLSYAVSCLKKKKQTNQSKSTTN